MDPHFVRRQHLRTRVGAYFGLGVQHAAGCREPIEIRCRGDTCRKAGAHRGTADVIILYHDHVK